MNQTAAIERIRGKLFRTATHAPIFLDDAARVLLVEEGHVDIFVVEMDREMRPASRWSFVSRLPVGAMAFGTSREVDHAFRLIAVPSQDAVVAQGERAGIESVDSLDLETTIWIDDWVARLSQFLARSSGPPAKGALLLEAEPNIPYPAEAIVTAQHRDVIWASADRTAHFQGDRRLTVPAGAEPVALTQWTWLSLDEAAKVSAVYTPTVFLQERVWPALDAFNRLIQTHAAHASAETARRLDERQRIAFEVRRASAAKMFHRLGGVLTAAGEHEAIEAAHRTPLQTAVSLVAEATGGTLKVPRNARDEGDLMEAVMKLTRPSGLHVRRISLNPGWWKRTGPSFIALSSDGTRPLALISNDGYRAVDPEAGTSFAVDNRQAAAAIADEGIRLYAPLPSHVGNGVQMMLYSLSGQGGDLRRLAAMAALSGLLALLTPVAMGTLFAEVIPRVDTSMWISFLAALLLAAFGTMMFDIVRAMAVLRIESRIDERIQVAVWGRLLSLPTGFFRRYTTGDLADRANGIHQMRLVLSETAIATAISSVFSIFSFGLLFYYSWSLALCSTALVLVLLIGTAVFTHRAVAHHREAFNLQGGIDGFLFQMITGIAKLRMAHAESYALAQWAERFADQKRETLTARRWMAGQATFNSLLVPLSTLTIFSFIWFLLIDEQANPFTLADFLSFSVAFGQFMFAMVQLTTGLAAIASIVPLFERVRPILTAEPEAWEDGIDPGDLAGEIEFSHVAFRYLPEVPNAVDHVSFRIRAGDFVAFVGPSGSGKSTVYRLLLGFEKPDTGSIFIDGHDLSSLDLAAVRSRMGTVLQNNQVMAASLFQNIAGTSSLTMDEAWAAARAAGLDQDIEAMPMGMHTILPEGGGGLSGGQKQRLIIARALAHKPRILLFDEATSALDNRTQAIVQASLNALNVTRVVIAHRLSTVEKADCIYVMDAGRIVESGRYDELIAKDGVFARLAKRQLI